MPLMSAAKPVEVAAPCHAAAAPAPQSFEEAAIAILDELQQAFVELLSAVPGGAHRAVDLERGLGLDKKLAWQVFKLAQADQALAETANVPVRPSMRRLLDAASSKRIPAKLIRRATEAFDRFEVFVAAHGGDRAGFQSLTSGMGLEPNEQAELKVRKSLFRGNAHVWGVRSAAIVRTLAFQKMSGPDRVEDSVGIVGDVGVHQLRREARFVLNRLVHVSEDPASDDDPATSVRERDIQELEVLQEFSTKPLPKTVVHREPDGRVETELVFPSAGRSGALTLYTSQFTMAGAIGEQTVYGVQARILVPTEMLICELLVPEGWADPSTARTSVYGRRHAVDCVVEARTTDLLPQRETTMYMGVRENVPPLAEVPQHHEAVRNVLQKQGWLGTKFDVYRCTVRYPVLQTLVRVAVDAFRR